MAGSTHAEEGKPSSLSDGSASPASDDDAHAAAVFAPIKTSENTKTTDSDGVDGDALSQTQTHTRPGLGAMRTSTRTSQLSQDELFHVLSSRRARRTRTRSSMASRAASGPAIAHEASETAAGDAPSSEDEDEDEADEGIRRLMSNMFGAARQQGSEEEKTRHVGLTWKHLTVTGVGFGAATQQTVGSLFSGPVGKVMRLLNPRRKVVKPPLKTIINDFSGVIRPGEMLLVLGRPGSGCSTLLKVLGNQRAGFTSVDGTVCYGGVSAETMAKNFRGEVLYNPEDDLHYATLSVKRTLEFALTTRTPGKESRLEGESREEYVKKFLETVTKLFWIEHTLNTFVGNESVRGVSGGERKRVSIAEALITKASTQMWDNSTKGLDASTALEYVKSIRTLTNMTKIASGVALYQAGEGLWDAFDKVVLIHEGRCCYFGPTDRAVAYFQALGFDKPERWTSSDFLTSVTDAHERRIKEGMEDRIPKTAEEFEKAFVESEVHKQNWAEIEEFEREVHEQREERERQTSKKTAKKNYTLPYHKQVLACTNRQFWVMLGDRQSLIGKWGGIAFQGLIVGSLFFDLQKTSNGVFQRGGALFFMLLFNALLALAELTSAFESRPVLLKHKTFSFYRPSAYAIGQTVIDLPLVAIQVTIFDLFVYWMANLQRTASQFFISWLILFVTTLSIYSFFRAVGAWAKSLDIATRFTGFAIQALIVYTGYLIPIKKMRPWLSWLRWINPIQYGFEALVANEFYNLPIRCEPPALVPEGPNVVPGNQGCALAGSLPDQTTVQGAAYIETSFDYSRAHLWRNIGIIIGWWIFFVVLTAIGMEQQKPNAGGGAVTVFKKGEEPASVRRAMEIGTTPLDEEKAEAAEKDRDGPEEDTRGGGDETEGIARNEKVFTFQNVNYTIPYGKGERKLLQNVSGYVKPGELTALMGSSGAGKTTLLNVLAQRTDTGVVTGDFFIDGAPLPNSFQRSTGYAEQMDIHEPTATVREAFRFSALLRQPKEVPVQEKYDYVEKIIDLLEMRELAGAIIGAPGEGLNQEQRKRVTLGVELAAKPELLLFLDEPTSGLDSQAAFNIVRFLRKLADAGQAILCTIHQPSAVLFEEFDTLLLLKSGGRVVFHGKLGQDSKNLLEYFESSGAKKCGPQQNPAEYMLEAIGAGDPNYKGDDWADKWERSKNAKEQEDTIRKLIEERRNASGQEGAVKADDREYAMPYTTQIKAVVNRCFVAYWRTPQYFIGKLALHIVTGLFNTFTFWKLDNSQIGMQNRLFSIFVTLTIAPPLIQQLQPRFIAFRDVYTNRESSSKIYSWSAFVLGAILPEIPYSLICGSVYWACWYWGVGFPAGFPAGYVYMTMLLFELWYVGLGQFIAALAPNALLASIMVPFFFLFVVSFCGIVVPFRALPSFWQSWMYWLTPFHYLLEGMLGVVTHNQDVECMASEFARFTAPAGQSCESYTQGFVQQAGGYIRTGAEGMCEFCQYATGDEFAASFNVFYKHRWRDFGIFWLYIGFNFAMVFLFTWVRVGGLKRVVGYFNPKVRRRQRERKQAGEKSRDA
jgi:ABC-type multidrug transport system ATPase subunit/ABC-type multidrug transport system permease subunit